MAQMAAAILALVLVTGLLTVLFETQTAHQSQTGASTPINLPDTLIGDLVRPGLDDVDSLGLRSWRERVSARTPEWQSAR